MKLIKHSESERPLPTMEQFFIDCLQFNREPTFEFEGHTYAVVDKAESAYTTAHPGERFEINAATNYYPAFNLRSRTVRGVHKNAQVKPLVIQVHVYPEAK